MKCRACGAVARMSRRRGLKEGTIDRLLLRAVYRCLECGLRFKIYAPDLAFRKTRKTESPFEYLGYGDERDKKKIQNILLIGAIVVIILVAAFQMRRTDDAATIRVDANGKRIIDPPAPVKPLAPKKR